MTTKWKLGDNLPGVPGKEAKTAAKLIGQFGTLDAVFDPSTPDRPDPQRERPMVDTSGDGR